MGEPTDGKTGWRENLLEWVKILVAAALIAFFINTFIIANSYIPSESMENTIMTNDRVLGSRLTYRFRDPERGEIAIFWNPDKERERHVKRIIGIPGDTVDIRNGQVYLNGSDTPIEEPYLPEAMDAEPDMHFEIPEDFYFMMGDNRNNSRDGRYYKNGFVARDKILAKVYFRYFPSIGRIE